MPRDSRTFRLFVSSTFSDLKAERNALQTHVFPRLKQLCLRQGCRFQDIDLRWGVSEEAGLDQRTMRICLQEVARCLDTTPRPNFLIVLGDRYGWCPLPYELPAPHYALLETAASRTAKARLEAWYRPDDNADPPVYRLQPRQRGGPLEKYGPWSRRVEKPLQRLLRKAARQWPDELGRYTLSATEHEIQAGALGPIGEPDRVFCCFRSIAGLPASAEAARFRDFEAGTPVEDAARRLANLRAMLEEDRFAGCTASYQAAWLPPGHWALPPDEDCRALLTELDRWAWQQLRRPFRPEEWDARAAILRDALAALPKARSRRGRKRPPEAAPITLDHLPRLCCEVYLRLARVIAEAIAGFGPADSVETEQAAHHEFGQLRARDFEGRRPEVARIVACVREEETSPLALVGEAGSGKTALMAHAAEAVRLVLPHASIISRYLGATPASTDGRQLLRGLCREIDRRTGLPDPELPDDYRALTREFGDRLSLATADTPLLLFLDALDMLSADDRADRLGWLPRQLPAHVSIIVSTTLEGAAAVLRRLPPDRVETLGPLSLLEGARLRNRWLAGAGRRLTRPQRRAIASAFRKSRSPLWLKLAFESSVEWSSRLEPSPLPPTVLGIIAARLAHLSDEANHGARMVERSLAYLAAARHGLTEDELIDLLSRDTAVMKALRKRSPESPPVSRLPVVVWSRLFHDLEPYLGRQTADGTTVITFYHQQVRRVASRAYLRGNDGPARHRRLGRYFRGDRRLVVEAAPGERVYNLRKLSEQPWQEMLAEQWSDLAATLSDLDFLECKVKAGAGYDAAADYERSRGRLPPAERYGDDSIERERTLLAQFGSAFLQELNAVTAWPETTGQQMFNNLYAQGGFDGVVGETLTRWMAGSQDPGRTWLRRLNQGPSTAMSRSLLRSMRAHDAPVTAVSVSPDRKWLASGGQDGTIGVWDAATGAEVARCAVARHAIAGLAWLGRRRRLRLVSADASGALVQWDWEGERAEAVMRTLPSRIRALVAVPPDRLAAATDDGLIRVWRPGADGEPLRHRDRVLCLAADRQGRLLLSGGADRTVRIWDLATGAEPTVLREPEREVRAVAIDQGGTFGVSGDETGTLRIWDLQQRRQARVVRAHRQRVTCLGVLTGEPLICSGSADTTVRVWDGRSAALRDIRRGHSRGVSCLTVEPDEQWFATGGEDGSVMIWDAAGAAPAGETREHDGPVSALAVFPSGGAASAGEDQTIRLWDAEGRPQEVFRGHVGAVQALAIAGGRRVCSAGADRVLRLWRHDGSGQADLLGDHLAGIAMPGTDPGLSAGHGRTVTCLLPIGDGRMLSAGDDGILCQWHLESRRLELRYEGIAGAIQTLVLNDGFIAAAGASSEVTLWRVGEARVHARLAGHDGRATCLTAAGEGRVASGGLDGSVRLWNLADGRQSLLLQHDEAVCSLASLPGTRLIGCGSVDGRVHLAATDRPGWNRELPGRDGAARLLAFEPGGGYLLCGSDAGRVFRWDTSSSALAGTTHLANAVTALRPAGAGRWWCGTRSGAVALFRHEPVGG